MIFNQKVKYSLVIAGIAIFIFTVVIPAFSGIRPVSPDYHIGPVLIHIYSFTMLAGAIAGFFIAKRLARFANIETRHVENLILVNLLSGLLGARIFHVFTAWEYYSQNPLQIFTIWQGGLGVFGGIAAGLLGTFIYARHAKVSFLRFADILSPALVVGLSIGRLGNFFNYEAYGTPTQLPWKMFVPQVYRLPGYEQTMFFHPSFLYESLWLLALGAILVRLFKMQARVGNVFYIFLILYFSGRFLLDTLRIDIVVWNSNLNGYLALIIVAAATVLLALSGRERVDS